MTTLRLHMNKNLFLKDPQETDLGRKIIKEGIIMIDQLGIEQFTFKKLAQKIDSTEASIYRYFENKHRLLVYIIAWYWNWLEYKIDYGVQNIDDPMRKLEIAIRIVAEKKMVDILFPEVDEEALYRIVIAESDKTYLTKQVDEENSEGLFRGIKSLCKKIASFAREINEDYAYHHALISTMLQAAHQQVYFAKHLPSLTELSDKSNVMNERNVDFLTQLVITSLSNKDHA